jgi:hypothetical protein
VTVTAHAVLVVSCDTGGEVTVTAHAVLVVSCDTGGGGGNSLCCTSCVV